MGKGKQKRKRKLKLHRDRRRRMGKIVRFNLANSPTKFKGLKNKYAYQSNMHNLIFKGAEFENVNYRASTITKCNFRQTSLKGVDFISVNLKNTSFKDAVFKDVIFFGANLKGADFANAEFKNTTFINTNLSNAKNLAIDNVNVTILNTYPDMYLDKKLMDSVVNLSKYDKIFKYHTLHVNKNKLNKWMLYLLLKNYSQYDLTRGFQALSRRRDKRNFYTVYSIKNFLNNYLKV